MDSGPALIQYDLILMSSHPKRPYFQIRLHSQVLVVRVSNLSFEGTQFNLQGPVMKDHSGQTGTARVGTLRLPGKITFLATHCSFGAYLWLISFPDAWQLPQPSQEGADPLNIKPFLPADPAQPGTLRRAQPAFPSPACLVPTPTRIPHTRPTRTIKAVSQAGGD